MLFLYKTPQLLKRAASKKNILKKIKERFVE
jgi:hypothetical protein